MARAGAEAGPVGVRQRAVVVQAGGVPVRPGRRVLPAQVVLPTAQAVLDYALALGGHPEPLELRRGPRRVEMTVEAGVQAELVAALMDAAHERADPRLLERVEAVQRRGVLGRQEIERPAEPVPLTHVHEEVERVVRIETVIVSTQPRPGAHRRTARPGSRRTRASAPS